MLSHTVNEHSVVYDRRLHALVETGMNEKPLPNPNKLEPIKYIYNPVIIMHISFRL